MFGIILQAADQIVKLYNMFIKVDATQIEINPFGETPGGKGKWLAGKYFWQNVILWSR